VDVLENIKQSVALLKEIEEYYEDLNGENGLISTCDRKIDYWEHYLELEPLKVTEVYNISREIKNQRILRRQYKNDAELIRIFKENEAKMQNASNRDILLVQVCKAKTKQDKAKYSYSAYTDEERDTILNRKKPEPVTQIGFLNPDAEGLIYKKEDLVDSFIFADKIRIADKDGKTLMTLDSEGIETKEIRVTQ